MLPESTRFEKAQRQPNVEVGDEIAEFKPCFHHSSQSTKYLALLFLTRYLFPWHQFETSDGSSGFPWE